MVLCGVVLCSAVLCCVVLCCAVSARVGECVCAHVDVCVFVFKVSNHSSIMNMDGHRQVRGHGITRSGSTRDTNTNTCIDKRVC